MRLNEAIDKALLDKIMPFEKWKEIQTDPRARKRWEQEQEEGRERKEQERLRDKYSNMTPQELENVWWNFSNDPEQVKHMLKYATIEEEQLEDWAETLNDSHSIRTAVDKAQLLIDFVGGPEMTKGNFGNRVISNMAKHEYNRETVKQLARSIQQRRSSFRRNNLTPEELERRDREWEKQQQPRDERDAEYKEKKEKEKREYYNNMSIKDAYEIWAKPIFARYTPAAKQFEELIKYGTISDKILNNWAQSVARRSHGKSKLSPWTYQENLLRLDKILELAGGEELSKGPHYGNEAISILAKGTSGEVLKKARQMKQLRRNYRRKNWKGKLNEPIDRSLLDQIPNFDEWREGGGSMEGYYRLKLSEKYKVKKYELASLVPDEHLEWALKQEPESTPDGKVWDSNVARRMSEIVYGHQFTTYYKVHYQYDDTRYPDVIHEYYKNGKFYKDDPYRGRGY